MTFTMMVATTMIAIALAFACAFLGYMLGYALARYWTEKRGM